tara:strand:- start:4383 stop:4661 length:279 start_codon:yes stop_codon:yes gene_type:complete
MGTTYKAPKPAPPPPPPAITPRASEADKEMNISERRIIDQKNAMGKMKPKRKGRGYTEKDTFKPTMINTVGQGMTVADTSSSLFKKTQNKSY